MFHYCISGLTVASEVALPGAIPAVAPEGTTDVRIRRADVPTALDGEVETGAIWQFDADRFLMNIPGVARFLLTGGRDVVFEPDGDVPVEDITIFLIGSIFGILLHQRGRIVLHASAVRVGDRAMLFCGPSGAGKSTMAATLNGQSYPMLTDDVCAIEIVDGTPMVHADGRQFKLWEHAITHLGLADKRGKSIRDSIEKYYVEPNVKQEDPLPLGGVYLLREERPPHEFGVAPLGLADVPLALRRNAYRPLLVQRMGQKADYFRAAGAINAAGGVHWLTRPMNFQAMPRVVDALRAHWAEREPAA